MMKIVNPLYREPVSNQTAAHGCHCTCNVALDNKADGDAGAWWIWNPSCGCGCNPSIEFNKSINHDTAESLA